MNDKKIIFMGTPNIAAQHLNTLIENNLNIVGVFTQPPRKKNRGMRIEESAVHQIASKNNIEVYYPTKIDNEVIAKAKSLEPDLIIVGGRTSKQLEAMSEIAPAIDLTVWGNDYLKQFYKATETLASIVDKEHEAAEKLAQIKHKVSQVNAAAQGAGNALFILTTGGKISAYGPGSRFGWLHEELGVEAAVENIKEATHGEPVSFEFLQEIDPDWLFVLDRDAAIGRATGAAEALLDNELVHNMKAHKNQQIVYLDGVSWYLVASGITAVDTAVSQVLAALNK